MTLGGALGTGCGELEGACEFTTLGRDVETHGEGEENLEGADGVLEVGFTPGKFGCPWGGRVV